MLTVLTGLNSYALNQKLSDLKAVFIEKYGKDGVEAYQAEQIQSGTLQSILGGATLFAPNRFIVIKNLGANKVLSEQFLAFMKNISSEVEVVLVESSIDKRTALYKALKKDAQLIELGELEEPQLSAWIQEEVRCQDGKIDSRTARTLIQYTGLDQARLSQEISKLIAYNPEITEATIAELVEPNPQDTVFQLLELALGGRTAKALEVLNGLERAHEDPFQVASMLVWQTHILAIVHSAKNLSDSEVAKSAKINPFVVRKTRSLANNMNRSKLNKILEVVADCDVQLKSTSTEPWRVVEQTIVSL